jgi:hypothetical protein
MTTLWIVAMGILAPASVAAAQERPCDEETMRLVRQVEREVRVREFDRYRNRLVNADLAGATGATNLLQITGGLSEDKATAKLQVAVPFAGAGAVSAGGSTSGSGVASIDVLDPLRYPTDYSGKVTVSWSRWKNVLSTAAFRNERCREVVSETRSLDAVRSNIILAAGNTAVGDALVISGSYEIGNRTFAFADPQNNYRKASESHRAQSFSVTGGAVMSNGSDDDRDPPRTSMLATYQYRRGYKDGSTDTSIYCQPIGDATASVCEKDALPGVAPVPKPGHALQIDVRHFPHWPLSPGLRVTRDFVAGFNTFEAPIYFVRKDLTDPYALTGGVTVGYRDGGSAEGRFVAVFFGTAILKPVPK